MPDTTDTTTAELPEGYVRVLAPSGVRELPNNKQTAERVLLEGYELLEGELEWHVPQGDHAARPGRAPEAAAPTPAPEPEAAAEPEAAPWHTGPDPIDGEKVADVADYAAAHPELAAEVLAYEQAHKARPSLVTKLEALVAELGIEPAAEPGEPEAAPELEG